MNCVNELSDLSDLSDRSETWGGLRRMRCSVSSKIKLDTPLPFLETQTGGELKPSKIETREKLVFLNFVHKSLRVRTGLFFMFDARKGG